MTDTKKKTSNMTFLAVGQIVVMVIITVIMVYVISSSTNRNSVDHILTLAKERSNTVESYVDNAELMLSAYSCANEITNLLSDPDNEEYVKAAQEYTEKISDNMKNLEGIYVSRWSTHVLAHTYKKYVGDPTREGERLEQLHAELLNSDNGMYNAGIIISPVSKEQIISIYKAVYDQKGNPAGIVGIGIMTTDIVKELEKTGLSDFPGSFYSMVDSSSGRYIFHSNTDKINTETNIPELKELCSQMNESNADQTGTFAYTENGSGYLSVYKYIGDRGWIFMIDDTHSELYALTAKMIGFLVLFAVFFIGIALMFNMFIKKQEEITEKLQSSLRKNEKAKESLSTAVYNDILTDTRNRVAFTNDFEDGKVKDSTDYPYYFAMFNICGFSNINIMYGEDVGDTVLSSVAATIRRNFEKAKVYRTGSDEFVAVVQCQANMAGQKRINGFVDGTLSALMDPVITIAGPVSLIFKAAIVKKSKNINTSVLPALKDVINQSGTAAPGQVGFLDLDHM